MLRIGPLVLVALSAVLIVACSGGDDEETPTPAAPENTRTAPASPDDNEGDPSEQDGTLSVGDTVTVLNPTGDSIALRVTPSMVSVTLGRAPNGSTAVISRGPTTAEGYTWYEIETSDGTGWTRSDFLIP